MILHNFIWHSCDIIHSIVWRIYLEAKIGTSETLKTSISDLLCIYHEIYKISTFKKNETYHKSVQRIDQCQGKSKKQV